MNDGPHPLDLNATLARMEPGIAPVDPMISLASLAISARAIHSEMSAIHADLADIRYAINNLNTMQGTNNISNVLDRMLTRLDHLSIMTDLKIQLEKIVKGLEHG